ncbi:MAG: holo-ACP synthase [Candidatus Kapabacteria bacterium]|nr:holo-ACP synthase [Candidatus Kapabacteria bacterium]MCS7170372.1 holo-ACP synthase [Candidatus Kapabacteria bacterium]MDW7996617.1 holo-ACP synthase [Bacteroidota bacterium]MDW8224582.1 holo-ACP synthase [Bacteroidota bacterium]
MIVGIGVDVVEVRRIESALERYGERFLQRIFTQDERDYCEQFGSQRALHYAARFAAKEAFSKALGIGMHVPFCWRDVSIVNGRLGKPELRLAGQLKSCCTNYCLHVSLSHTAAHAVAVVLIEQREEQ